MNSKREIKMEINGSFCVKFDTLLIMTALECDERVCGGEDELKFIALCRGRTERDGRLLV
jgi:hypothetical protein